MHWWYAARCWEPARGSQCRHFKGVRGISPAERLYKVKYSEVYLLRARMLETRMTWKE